MTLNDPVIVTLSLMGPGRLTLLFLQRQLLKNVKLYVLFCNSRIPKKAYN
jgi:hypothetical protein